MIEPPPLKNKILTFSWRSTSGFGTGFLEPWSLSAGFSYTFPIRSSHAFLVPLTDRMNAFWNSMSQHWNTWRYMPQIVVASPDNAGIECSIWKGYKYAITTNIPKSVTNVFRMCFLMLLPRINITVQVTGCDKFCAAEQNLCNKGVSISDLIL